MPALVIGLQLKHFLVQAQKHVMIECVLDSWDMMHFTNRSRIHSKYIDIANQGIT